MSFQTFKRQRCLIYEQQWKHPFGSNAPADGSCPEPWDPSLDSDTMNQFFSPNSAPTPKSQKRGPKCAKMWLVEGGWSHLLPGNWFGAEGRQLPALGLAVAEFSELLAGVPTTAAAAAAGQQLPQHQHQHRPNCEHTGSNFSSVTSQIFSQMRFVPHWVLWSWIKIRADPDVTVSLSETCHNH